MKAKKGRIVTLLLWLGGSLALPWCPHARKLVAGLFFRQALCVLLLALPAAMQAQFAFQPMECPYAESGLEGGTYPLGISGTNIVGGYIDTNDGAIHGFVYGNGAYSVLNDPNSGYGTVATGVSGTTIVGWYSDDISYLHGFICNGGVFTTLDDPNAVYLDGDFFPFDEPGGNITLLELTMEAGNGGTVATGVSGTNVVGWYVDSNSLVHGFLFNGTSYTTLDDPNGVGATYPQGISGNNIVGWYVAGNGSVHGFLYNGSTYTTLDDPNGVGVTYPQGISGNNIVGYYTTNVAAGNGIGGHSFIYNGSSYTELDDPSAYYGAATSAQGISGNNVIGWYLSTNYGIYGFDATLGGVQTGSLQVTINPAVAVTAGAEWCVDGGIPQSSGATVSDLPTGNHIVTFSAISGFVTPPNQTVSVSANSTSTVTGTYVAIPQTGSLQVTITPAAVIAAGAEWQVDGGTLQNSGATIAGLSIGSHTVSFTAVDGWTTPTNQTVSVSANVTATVNGIYVLQAPPQITTTELPNATNGVAYSQQLSAINGQPPYTWSIYSSSLPSGLALASNGIISGTPTQSGPFNFTVEVTDALSETATQALQLTVVAQPSAAIPVLLSAPSSDSSFYGMYSPDATAAAFTLTNSYYVSTIDVTLYTPGTNFNTYHFTVQNSLTNPFTVFASQDLTAAAGVSTQVMNVKMTLSAGTYYLTGIVPGYSGTTVTPGNVDGWFMSTGSYDQTGGTIENGVWVDSNPPTFTTGGVYVAPAFTVNTAIQLGMNSAQSINSNGFNLVLYSLPGLNYEIETSTNLIDWTAITNFVSTTSPFDLNLPITTIVKQQFYRAVLP